MAIKILMASVFCIIPLLVVAATATTELFLSTDELDLLMGTPAGVVEPLDGRRTVISEKDRVDYSNMLDDDFSLFEHYAIQDWHDAEETLVDESNIETEYLDLVSETSELEEITQESEFLVKYFDEKSKINAEEKEIVKEEIETDEEL